MPPSALAEMFEEAANSFPLETGGVLMGSWDDHRTIVVTDVIGPGPNAIHGPHVFDPDQRWQEQRVADVWRLRAGKVAYLGDWHTHPGRSVKPSRLDLEAAATIGGSPEACAPRPILMIVGLGPNGSVELGAFVLAKRRLRRTRVEIPRMTAQA